MAAVSAASPRPSPALPPEIWLIVITLLVESMLELEEPVSLLVGEVVPDCRWTDARSGRLIRSTLRRCSLVCRTLREVSVGLLFRRLTWSLDQRKVLPADVGGSASESYHNLVDLSALLNHTKEFRVLHLSTHSIQPTSDKEFATALRYCTNLHSLYLEAIPVYSSLSQALQACGRKIGRAHV